MDKLKRDINQIIQKVTLTALDDLRLKKDLYKYIKKEKESSYNLGVFDTEYYNETGYAYEPLEADGFV